jgi:MoaA/NifB/PqqE/SkfB family radical SAM enzyme
MPDTYKSVNHYVRNEMPTDVVIETLKGLKRHNPEMFHIFYGGEPLLRKDLPDIINFCNENDIFYTIISNNTPVIQPLIKRLFDKTEYVQGFTSSVDPIFNEDGVNEDSVKKSIEGLKRLKEIQAAGNVKDVVAEITVMNHNKHLLHQLVKELSENEIYSDITFVDISKSPYYDFSNITEMSELVMPTDDLKETFKTLLEDDSLLIHMKDYLLPRMFNTLPSEFDCELENGLHNLTIDADGSIRLCLRIRGEVTPHLKVNELFDPTYPELISNDVFNLIKIDKRRLCKRCNHSCLMMSQHIDSGENIDDLVHMDKREE